MCDLAQALRDGVLLCQLLNNLLPQAVNLREINLRPQMSQFLCLKNIRTFLGACHGKFHLRKSDLFEAFDLFDVRDFGKVIDTLSILSHSAVATQRGFRPFPLEGCAADDEIYSGLSDQMDDTVDEDDDLYDFVEDEENKGDEIYEDLMRTDEQPEVVGVGVRSVQRVVQAQLPTGPHWALTASSGVSLHSSRRLAWTSESAACRRSDRRRRNTRIRSSPFYSTS